MTLFTVLQVFEIQKSNDSSKNIDVALIVIISTLLATVTALLALVRRETKIELQIGSSESVTKSIYFNKSISSCPSDVRKEDRTNTDFSTMEDTFKVNVVDDRVTVTRSDKASTWGMNLKFECCGYTDTEACQPPHRPCVPRAPFTPCTGEEGDEDIELEIGSSSSSEIAAKLSLLPDAHAR